MGDGALNITVCYEPSLLLEAAEVVYAFVNDIASKRMTLPTKYYLPVEAVDSIRNSVCAGLSAEDPQLQFYFRGVPVEGIADRLSCLGCCLLYYSVEVAHPGVDDMARALSETRAGHRRNGYSIYGIDPFTVNLAPAEDGAFASLSGQIARLPVGASYRMQLVEVFSAFDEHLERVVEILRPVAQALGPLLAPWVEQARDRMAQWEPFFRQNSAEEFLMRHGHVKAENLQELQIGFRYFSPLLCPIYVDDAAGRVSIHMGIGICPKMEPGPVPPVMDENRYAILRLLANPDRVEMLRLMAERPMGVPELSKRLHLNSGSVFRDVNSMHNAQLLLFQQENGKNLYSTNLSIISRTASDLVAYIQNDRPGRK